MSCRDCCRPGPFGSSPWCSSSSCISRCCSVASLASTGFGSLLPPARSPMRILLVVCCKCVGLGGAVARGYLFALACRPWRRTVAERLAAQRFPAVRRQPIFQFRAFRHNAARVDVLVHEVVVLLDLDKVDGVAKARRLE